MAFGQQALPLTRVDEESSHYFISRIDPREATHQADCSQRYRQSPQVESTTASGVGII